MESTGVIPIPLGMRSSAPGLTQTPQTLPSELEALGMKTPPAHVFCLCLALSGLAMWRPSPGGIRGRVLRAMPEDSGPQGHFLPPQQIPCHRLEHSIQPLLPTLLFHSHALPGTSWVSLICLACFPSTRWHHVTASLRSSADVCDGAGRTNSIMVVTP